MEGSGERKIGFIGDGNGNGQGIMKGRDVAPSVFEAPKNETLKSSIENESGIEKNRELIEKSFKEIFSLENNQSIRIFSQKKNKVTPLGTHLSTGNFPIGSITRLRQMFLEKYRDADDLNEDDINERIKSFCLENLDSVNPTVDMRRAIKAVFGEDDSMGNPYVDEPKEYEKNTTLPGAKHLGSAAAVKLSSKEKKQNKNLLNTYIKQLFAKFKNDFKKLDTDDQEIINKEIEDFVLMQENAVGITKEKFTEAVKPFFFNQKNNLGLSVEGVEYIETVFGEKKKDIYNEEEWTEFLNDERNKDWRETFEKAKVRIVDLVQTPDQYMDQNPEHMLSESFQFDLRMKLNAYLKLEINKDIELSDDEKNLWRKVLAASKNICADNPMKFFVHDGRTWGVTDKKAVNKQEAKRNSIAKNEGENEGDFDLNDNEKMAKEFDKAARLVEKPQFSFEEFKKKQSPRVPIWIKDGDISLELSEYVEILSNHHEDAISEDEKISFWDRYEKLTPFVKRVNDPDYPRRLVFVEGKTYAVEKSTKKDGSNEERKKNDPAKDSKTAKNSAENQKEKTEIKSIENLQERTGEELYELVNEKTAGVFSVNMFKGWVEGYWKIAYDNGLGEKEVMMQMKIDIEKALHRAGAKEGKEFEKVVQYVLDKLK